jgi:hypothetical protein
LPADQASRLAVKRVVVGLISLVAGAAVLEVGTGSASTDSRSTVAMIRCSGFRGKIKTLGDPAAGSISNTIEPSSVTSLRKLPRVAWTKNRKDPSKKVRLAPVERTIYRINVKLLRFKFEHDNNIHLVVAEPDKRKKTMIVEFVAPACGKSRTAEMANARTALFTACGQPPPKGFQHFSPGADRATATITGFYDYKHHQSGVASNGIELHPALSFQATSACTPL